VTRLFKPCPLRGNGSINKGPIARQQPATIEEMLVAVFSMRSVPSQKTRSSCEYKQRDLALQAAHLPADKPTTVQVSNCRFLGLNKLRHRLLHYPALADVPVYSRTLCQFCFVNYVQHVQKNSVNSVLK
jgi:hypothetical protein